MGRVELFQTVRKKLSVTGLKLSNNYYSFHLSSGKRRHFWGPTFLWVSKQLSACPVDQYKNWAKEITDWISNFFFKFPRLSGRTIRNIVKEFSTKVSKIANCVTIGTFWEKTSLIEVHSFYLSQILKKGSWTYCIEFFGEVVKKAINASIEFCE